MLSMMYVKYILEPIAVTDSHLIVKILGMIPFARLLTLILKIHQNTSHTFYSYSKVKSISSSFASYSCVIWAPCKYQIPIWHLTNIKVLMTTQLYHDLVRIYSLSFDKCKPQTPSYPKSSKCLTTPSNNMT
jgi:hypothetical protein